MTEDRLYRLARPGLAPILLVVFGCASPDRLPAPVAVETATVTPEMARVAKASELRYRACLMDAAKLVDDGHMNPSRVALLAAPLCYPQFADYSAQLAEQLPSGQRQDFARRRDQRQVDMATDAIAALRARTNVASTP